MMGILNQKGRKNRQRVGITFRAVGCQVTVLTANLYCKKCALIFDIIIWQIIILPQLQN